MTDHDAVLARVGLSAVVDVFDHEYLFEEIDNHQILHLSRLNGEPGFANVENIRRSTGVSVRRLLAEDTSALDVADALCRRLQSVSGTSMCDFSGILLCHSSTDSTACIRLAMDLTNRFRLPVGAILPVNHGCSGFLKLLQEGAILLDQAAPGSRVALLSVETPETWHDASDRLFCGIVSAGATAAVLEHDAGLPLSVVRSDDFEIPPDRRINDRPLFHKDTTKVYSFRGQPLTRTVMRMNPEPVFLNAIELMLNSLRAAMVSIDPRPGNRIIVAPHQPSGKLLRALVAAAMIEYPDIEFLNNLDRYGNMISSSVPTLLSRLPEVLKANELPPLRDGDFLILLAAGICMNQIEHHMSGGHACLQWQNNVLNQSLANAKHHAVSSMRPHSSATYVTGPAPR